MLAPRPCDYCTFHDAPLGHFSGHTASHRPALHRVRWCSPHHNGRSPSLGEPRISLLKAVVRGLGGRSECCDRVVAGPVGACTEAPACIPRRLRQACESGRILRNCSPGPLQKRERQIVALYSIFGQSTNTGYVSVREASIVSAAAGHRGASVLCGYA